MENNKKIVWKPGNMLYPVPAVMVSMADFFGNKNIITVAWAGTLCSDPAMVSISIRPKRHSYSIIKETGEFVINLVTEELAYGADWCGVKSGREFDKFKEMGYTAGKPARLKTAPTIEESPVNIECKVNKVWELGSHHMFVADVVCVQVSGRYMDKAGKFHLNAGGIVAYSHGEYRKLGKKIGTFGYSVAKRRRKSGK